VGSKGKEAEEAVELVKKNRVGALKWITAEEVTT
jgi:hypothetical protein